MTQNTPNTQDAGWRLDKKIPLALILTVTLQTAAIGVWVGNINSRVNSLEAATGRFSDNGDKLIRLDEKMNTVQQQQTEIKEELRRMSLRGGK